MRQQILELPKQLHYLQLEPQQQRLEQQQQRLEKQQQQLEQQLLELLRLLLLLRDRHAAAVGTVL